MFTNFIFLCINNGVILKYSCISKHADLEIPCKISDVKIAIFHYCHTYQEHGTSNLLQLKKLF